MSKDIKIKLKSYDPKLMDSLVVKIIEVAKGTGANTIGPIPLPTRRELFTILRAVHKYKDSREQYELRTHKRLIQITNITPQTMDKLNRLSVPAGVMIDIKS